jgi:hypothetical protein
MAMAAICSIWWKNSSSVKTVALLDPAALVGAVLRACRFTTKPGKALQHHLGTA